MRTILIVSSIVFSSALAHAEPPRAQASNSDSATEYGFDDELVMGASFGPNSERVSVRKGAKRSTLVEVKTSLLPELLISVENL